MTQAAARADRIAVLDVIRGIAVMGIFSVNVVGMAMIQIAYFYPPAFGFEGIGDKLMWLANFILVDGKMRALFSILFGASMMLVIERAVRAGRPAWRTHYPRMVVLLLFGYLHFMLLWWGDILAHYAAVGMVAFLLWKLRARTLMIVSISGFALFAAPGVYFFATEIPGYYQSQKPDAPAHLKKKWAEREKKLHPDAKTLAEDRAEHRSIAAHTRASVSEGLVQPLDLGPLWIETFALMLLGMAGYKSGFLTGEWPARSYRKVAAIGLGIGLAVFSVLGAIVWSADFAPPQFFGASNVAAPPFRPLMAMGYAAAIILLFRNRSALRDRLAAVGRTAFTNYVGCTILGTLAFYGFGGDLYARLSRGEAWLFVPAVWLLMLAWSKPWLDRFNYGPLEWAWRSLARWQLQPMRRGARHGDSAAAAAA